MMRKVIGALLIVHGLITSMFMFYIEDPSGPGVGWNGYSWLLTDTLGEPVVQILGKLLWAVAVFAFVLAGFAVLARRKEWRMIDILASAVSLLAYLLFWSGLEPVPEYWILGPVISVVSIVALVIVRWPPDELVLGAESEQ